MSAEVEARVKEHLGVKATDPAGAGGAGEAGAAGGDEEIAAGEE
jgi:hypothetical protein